MPQKPPTRPTHRHPVAKGPSEAPEAAGYADDPLYRLTFRGFKAQFARESFAFWMICAYLVVEYVRPQSIFEGLDLIPWGQIFLVAAFIGAVFDKDCRWVSSTSNTLMTIFLGVVLLSIVFAEYPEISRKYWFDFFGWYVIYFLVINIVRTEKRLFIFVMIFLVASFKLSFFGARTWASRGFGFADWGIMGPPGPFQNSGELSIQMLMAGAIGYHMAIFLRPFVSRLKYWLLAAIPITSALTVLGASSRGAQLALAAQVGGSALARSRKNRLKILIAVIAVGAIGFALLPDEQKARFENMGDDQTSEQRMLYLTNGVEMVKEHPVLGVGFYNFAPYYAEHFPEDILFGVAQLPHNIFIQVGTDAGLLGLITFLSLIVCQFLALRRVRRLCKEAGLEASLPYQLSSGLRLALWGYLIAGQFVTVTYYPFFWINLSMSIALLNITRQLVQPSSARADHEKRQPRAAARA
jgi:O-antigen ligase